MESRTQTLAPEEKQQLMGQKDWPKMDLLWRKEAQAALGR